MSLVTLVPKAPNRHEKVIGLLEEVLAFAKENSMDGIAISFTYEKGTTGDAYYAPDAVLMLGALEVTKRNLLECIES